MAAGDAGAWARLRLVQGASKTPNWELVSTQGEARVTVGHDPTCSWVINDASVAPLHLTLRWDGLALSVADTLGAGNVRLDGRTVTRSFTRVAGRARLEFGRCAIVAETSVGGARLPQPLKLTSVPPPSSAASKSVPPRPARESSKPSSSRPPARTWMGTGSGAPPPRPQQGAGGSVRVERAVPTGSTPPVGKSTAGDSERPKTKSDRPVKATVVGMGPPPGRPATTGQGTAANSTEPSLGSTLYGIGQRPSPASVDVVSPERLRRSSRPAAAHGQTPPPAAEEPAHEEAGRATEPGFAPEDGERLTRPGFVESPALADDGENATRGAEPSPTDTRLVDDTGQMRALSGLATEGSGLGHTGGNPTGADLSGGYAGQAPEPPSPSTRPGRHSPVLATVLAIAAMVAFGVWVYALITL